MRLPFREVHTDSDVSVTDPEQFKRLTTTEFYPIQTSSSMHRRPHDPLRKPFPGHLISHFDQDRQQELNDAAPGLFSRTEIFKSVAELQLERRRMLPGTFVAARWVRLAHDQPKAPTSPRKLMKWTAKQANAESLPLYGQVSIGEIVAKKSWLRPSDVYEFSDYVFAIDEEMADGDLAAVADEGLHRHLTNQVPAHIDVDQNELNLRIFEARSAVKEALEAQERKKAYRKAAREIAKEEIVHAARSVKKGVKKVVQRPVRKTSQPTVRRKPIIPFTEKRPTFFASLLDPNALGRWEDRREDHHYEHGSNFNAD